MDAQIKARVEAALKVPAVVAGGLLGDLRALYEHATAQEAEVERLRHVIERALACNDAITVGALRDKLRAALAGKE